MEYSFTALAQVKDINDAATAGNHVTLLEALNAAGIKNINEKLIGTYATDIDSASPKAVTIADVQEIVDDANDAAVKAGNVKAVQDAKTQTAVYNALNTNFHRVNSAWAKEYVSGSTSQAGIAIVAAPTANTIYADNAGTTGTTPTAVQAAIDTVNQNAITLADSNATTAAEQAKVTALIQKWVKDDVGTSKAKANQIKASQVKEAAYKVEEATTQNTVYSALVNLANLDNTTANLNAKLAPYYFAEHQTATLDGTVGTINSDVIQAADAAAKSDALDDVETAYQAINTAEQGAGATSTQIAALKSALQTLSDYTSHTSDKLDMSIVKDENLVKYAEVFAQVTAIDNTSTVSAVVNKIKKANAAQDLDTTLDIINDENSTAVEVRDALTEIAVARNTGGSATEATKFINLSPQAKLEIAEMVIESKPAAGYSNKNAILNSTDGTGAIATAIVAHGTELAKFNAIGDLANATTAATKGHLDTYAYDAYNDLTASQKLAVAEEINKLAHVNPTTGAVTPYNFTAGQKDEVKTLKAANDIIDAAIAKVK